MWAYIQLLRPAQWIKNTFVFAALIFGAKLGDWHAIALATGAFVAFCLTSSAGYIFNDILDRERDRLHPVKRNRPIASGLIPLPAAGGVGLALLLAAAIVSIRLPPAFMMALCTYLALTVLYSLFLKHRMLLDVITIALLFVIRAVAGAVAINVAYSDWLLVCTFMLCLFLGFGKRRCEIAMLANGEAIHGHRRTLDRYSPDLLNQLLSTSGGIAIITFLLYTLWPDAYVGSPFGAQSRHDLLYTLPLVVYGIYRYAMLIESGKATGPTDLIIKDPPFLVSIALWVVLAGYILYGRS
ncbi:MAG TPA: decaprenyl-phosphate phosphoribosyltransferase [Phycisphaerae bacterium]|jgi:4-hydroxybenzoate polyprenyltransferase|nr:decaprenyl-phosphate phosphoribosyltransferase [Phycisphaerae bacterium]HOB74094.1 decaprenyl-phosphate phosphoribosyltransferase [Phycisphaerae bacterium]HOJ56757.1 decaprenyl-phosphate phosphoribosyltransferase [Phycisphaerae bacterium]HOL25380.1 decaprenyl-phosphate phosphoribosyltransferase [Phycisphaerae bacterium]HPP22056.1 decaprenyl-phosphate phosphoribosyltransferase [Phycisphaerae bacterium]